MITVRKHPVHLPIFLYTWNPDPSQSQPPLYNHQSTHNLSLPFLILPFSGQLMAVILP